MKCHIHVLLFVDEMTSKVLIKYFHHKEWEHYPCFFFFFILKVCLQCSSIKDVKRISCSIIFHVENNWPLLTPFLKLLRRDYMYISRGINAIWIDQTTI
jgi:hypothetical protein